MSYKSIYLFYGEEKYLIESEVNKMKKKFGDLISGINFISIDESNAQNLIADIQTPAFGYPRKLIIVKNSGLFKKNTRIKKDSSSETEKKTTNTLSNKIANYINDNIEFINEYVDLIFIEEDVDKNELYKTIEKNGTVLQYNKLKPIEAENKIKSICNAYKVNIDNQTLKYFVEICGTDMQNLINEIRKQIEFASSGGKITKESIDKLAIKQIDVVIFDLTDNLGKKNTKESLEILANMLYEKEPIQKILITLYNHFKKLYLTKIAINEKRNIAEALNLKPTQMFLTTKYSNQCKYFTQDELRKILQSMIDLDYNYKRGMIDPEVGLQTIICNISK